MNILTHLEAKHTEFADLFADYVNTFLSTPAGQRHLTAYVNIRQQAQTNFAAIVSSADRGEDISTAVIAHLLPYADTDANRKAGRWQHIAPAFVSDVRVKYQAAGWTQAADWPQVAHAIFDFVRRVIATPSDLASACIDFDTSPYSKGFQMGTLTPILNALRPDAFVLINSKPRRVINYLTGTHYSLALTDYADINTTAHTLLDAMADTIHAFNLPDALDADIFDEFCHWLITIKHFEFNTPALVDPISSAAPFAQIFASREEAEWAFDLIRETLTYLGVEHTEDERFALTLRDHNRTLSLTFGKWTILQFIGPCYTQFRVGLPLKGAHLDVIGPYDQQSPLTTYDDAIIRPYIFPMDTVKPLQGVLRKTYHDTLAYIAEKFGNWKATHVRRLHQQQLAHTVFDTNARAVLFGDFQTHCAKDEPVTYKLNYQPIYSLSQCARDTHLDPATLSRWLRAIERKKQAIFYGPPGTGKTFVAEKLARHLVSGSDGFYGLVQFHPAYAYEDFIQGLRPQTNAAGALSYPMVPGRFLDFCAKAETRSRTCVLIIDELNRANLARVFGELLYLLEYRDQSLPLAGGGILRIPHNVRILGTLNTADRSIALLDHALRRRFAFIHLRPNYAVLRRYHADTGFDVHALIGVLQRLNAQIADPHYELGITFFLHPDLATHLEDIWRMEIEPYLEEYFFDQRDKVDAFRWQNLNL